MKRGILLIMLFFALTAVSKPVRCQEKNLYNGIGKSIFVKKINKVEVKVLFWSHEIDIGSPDNPKVAPPQFGCTYSHFPCSVVDSMKVSVDGKVLATPKSVISGLSDLNKIEFGSIGKRLVLTTSGGDASESYLFKIEFDKKRFLSKKEYSGLDESYLLTETKYYPPFSL